MVGRTFGIRFNAFHGERGHVFQSRYKSLLVEEGRPLLGLVNYIHLNAVRAGITALDQLRDYPWSSYPKFFEPKPPGYLVRKRFLASLEFPDTVSGMLQYERHLEFAEESHPGVQDELARRYCQAGQLGQPNTVRIRGRVLPIVRSRLDGAEPRCRNCGRKNGSESCLR